MTTVNFFDSVRYKEWLTPIKLTSEEQFWNDETDKKWLERYGYEAHIITNNVENMDTILELGAGAGGLSKLIIEKNKLCPSNYDLIDTAKAKIYFLKRNIGANFIVQDIENDIDVSVLRDRYDLIIMNDILEHLKNPSLILSKVRELMDNKSTLTVSIPNWRMHHHFIYPGLFDYDNFLAFLYNHGFIPFTFVPSCYTVKKSKPLSSEKGLIPAFIGSWNFYFFLKRREF